MEKMRIFEESGLGACAVLNDDILGVDERGILLVPQDARPAGFHLMVLVKKDARTVVVQKNVGQKGGDYHTKFLSQLSSIGNFEVIGMEDPIEVVRAGRNVWTAWHKDKPNRVDCWQVGKDGSLRLFQVGVITHDNGQTWRLHGEYRWKGRLFNLSGEPVAYPEEPKWGSFITWRPILDHPEFKELVDSVDLQPWEGDAADLNPLLDPVPDDPKLARMQWYIVFAGQTGQGPAFLSDGSTAWVHGIDILDPPDPDGFKRLWRNDLVSFSGAVAFGKKPNGPPKLLNVKRVA